MYNMFSKSAVNLFARNFAHRRLFSTSFEKLMENNNVREKMYTISKNYVKIIKWPIGLGSGVGLLFGTAYYYDEAEKRELSRVELLTYPIGGTFIGAAVGATFPFWLVVAPVTYALGSETSASIFKAIIVGSILLTDKDEDKKN